MSRRALSKRFVDRAPVPEAGRAEYFDTYCPGFMLRVTANGKKSYAVMGRVKTPQGPKLVRVTLGDTLALEVDEAREAARAALASMAKGVNPNEEKRRKASEIDRKFGAVVALFLEKYAEPNQRPRTYAETKRNLENYFVNRWTPKKTALKPLWKDREIGDITRADVIARLDEISEQHGATHANRCFAALRKFYNWCISARSLLEHSPCDRLSMPSKETPRERYFTDMEIPKLWKAADAEAYPFGVMLKLLLLTGQRRSEVAGMRWDEVDLEAGLWELPRSRTKNNEAHVVPLSSQALALLKAIPKRVQENDEPCPYVFTTNAETPVSGFSKAVGRMVGAAALSEPWSLHACRHTVRTALSGLEVSETVIRRILNHAEPGISGKYDHHRYTDEKRRALQRWADKIDRLLTEKPHEKVVELRA